MGTRYATIHQREEMQKSVSRMEGTLSDPVMSRGLKNPEDMRRSLAREKKQLAEMTPPPIENDIQRKALVGREAALRDAMIQGSSIYGAPAMPTRRQMEEKPAGAVGQHTLWENYWKRNTIDQSGRPIEASGGYGAVFENKDLMRRLHPDREAFDPDLANIERFRPDDDKVPLADHRTPRSYGLSAEAKEKYDEVFTDHEPTPVEKILVRPSGELTSIGTEPSPGLIPKPPVRMPEKPAYKCGAKKANGELCEGMRLKGQNGCRHHMTKEKEVGIPVAS